jgi:hypothetical protein
MKTMHITGSVLSVLVVLPRTHICTNLLSIDRSLHTILLERHCNHSLSMPQRRDLNRIVSKNVHARSEQIGGRIIEK